MDWFERLTGVRESSPSAVRAQLELSGTRLRSRVNGLSWECGRLEIPALGELRLRASASASRGRTTLRELVGDSRSLHADVSHAGALFQVASQFNLLEMPAPHVTPERGIGAYESDRTQGPACAVAAGAGTILRNYFVELPGQVGQSAERQVDGLAELGAALGNADDELWTMTNGYALPRPGGLEKIAQRLGAMGETQRDELRGLLRIGVQWDTEVTLEGCGHRVTQAYCSALPVGYAREPSAAWEPFARLVLEAAYEATFCAARINADATSNRTLFLTLVGGGVFGNEPGWILDATRRALRLHAEAGLDVVMVSYRAPNPALASLLAEFGR